MYKCSRCNASIENLPKGVIRCPVCAYKVIYKVRSPITKVIKAE